MRNLFKLGLCSSLLWTAVGCCCCYDTCSNYCGGYNSAYNYGTNYNSLATGGYSTTAQTTTNSNYLASNQSNYSATTAAPTVLPQNNGMQYTQQGAVATQQYNSGLMQSGTTPCPCASNNFPTETYMQDANGMPIPMEGMVYDASVMPTPVMTAPQTTTVEKNAAPTQPGQLIPVPQAQIGIPTGADGQPLVPPAE